MAAESASHAKLMAQLEFYLSDSNLAKDRPLREHVARGGETSSRERCARAWRRLRGRRRH